MSRSYRHTPIHGRAAYRESEKADKRLAHRGIRALLRQRLKRGVDYDLFLDVAPGEAAGDKIWAWSKDGKFYWDASDARRIGLFMEWQRMMRK